LAKIELEYLYLQTMLDRSYEMHCVFQHPKKTIGIYPTENMSKVVGE